MVNCNPETVSTDYDTSDRLYFEPLTLEDVLEVLAVEKPEGVIVQFGGQTPLKLSRALEAAGAPIIGTSPDSIDVAEDRERFQALVRKLGLKQPANATARNEEQGVQLAREVGFPLVVRPSYVLGGRAMEVVFTEGTALYMTNAVQVSNIGRPARPFPERRDRGGRRRVVRRRGRRDRRHHGAHRAGRRALGRLLLLAAAEQPQPRDAA
jgi:carbamoyl-phosphate synthase large subunit